MGLRELSLDLWARARIRASQKPQRRLLVVGLGRVELPTNGLGNRCSIHLSYRPVRRILAEAAPAADRGIAVPEMETPYRKLLTARPGILPWKLASVELQPALSL